MAELPILYSYFRSSCSWRVRIALALKQIKYKQIPVHLLNNGGEQHSDEYKTYNPMEQVPTLIMNGLTLTQSLPIIEYIDELHPETNPLLPGDPVDRFRVRQIAEVINSGIQPVQNLSVLQAVGPERKMQWGHDAIHKGFVAIEALLTTHRTDTDKYCVGTKVTLADICLVPQVYNASRFKVDMSQFPTIHKINSALEDLEEFKTAHFTCQPDTPEELRPASLNI